MRVSSGAAGRARAGACSLLQKPPACRAEELCLVLLSSVMNLEMMGQGNVRLGGVCCGSVGSRSVLDQTSPLCGSTLFLWRGQELGWRRVVGEAYVLLGHSSLGNPFKGGQVGEKCRFSFFFFLRQNLLKPANDHLTSLCLRAGEIQLGFL